MKYIAFFAITLASTTAWAGGAAASGPRAEEEKSGMARATLVVGQTLHGLVAGAELCLALDCEGGKPFVGAIAGGGALGLGVSLVVSSGGLTPGQAHLVNMATLFGMAHGAGIAASTDGDVTLSGLAGPALAGQIVATAAGALLAPVLRPTADQVLFVTAIAASGAGLVGLATLFDDGDTSPVPFLIAGDAAILAGSLIAREMPFGSSRTVVVFAGGGAGAMLGGAIAYLASDELSAVGLATGILAGGLLGGAGTSVGTRSWEEGTAAPSTPAAGAGGDTAPSLFVRPLPGGLGLGLAGSF